jgi:DNA invertase Pin-like site-specific DNA recombinase
VKTAYDDGGLSGGTMERPALQRLLADISQGLVDVVVVYKVDRLTRSLSDFAKMVEVFDARGVSFVAVTQQFNTTTSMGRLTLNVLLSFAQFEREVTGERIRDKIAASKQKGMWMGGLVPIGFDVHERRLVVNQSEAKTVRELFQRYLELGSVRLLMEDLNRRGVRSKVRVAKNGKQSGGNPFFRGALCALLSNPIYVGEIRRRLQSEAEQTSALAALVDRVELKNDGIGVSIKLPIAGTGNSGSNLSEAVAITRAFPMQLKRRGVELRMIVGDHNRSATTVDPPLLKAVARAHRWFDELSTGKASSLAEIAAHEGLAVRYVGRVIRLAFLAPDIVESIVEGRQPTSLTAESVTRHSEIPLE